MITSTEIKLCKDCRHFEQPYKATCGHPEVIRLHDPVYGANGPAANYCRTVHCGVLTPKYFEAKDAIPTSL